MISKVGRLSKSILAAVVPLIGALAFAECPEGKIEVVRTNPSGKTHTQCVSENAAAGMGQAADNSAGTVTYATFTPLGELVPGGSYGHQMWDISADGSTIVGIAKSLSGFEAFRWTETDGMIGLGDFDGGRFFSAAFGVSADGSVVVGRGEEDLNFHWPFRWSADTSGMVALGDCAGDLGSTGAYGISDDGTTIAGACEGTIYRWLDGAGGIDEQVVYEGLDQSVPFDISADGSAIVGQVYKGSEPFAGYFYEAFRWTESGGMQPLGTVGDGHGSTAFGMSPDGSVVVGRYSGHGSFPMRWTEATGMVPLAGGGGYARDASTEGLVIVGELFCGDASRAVLWLQGGDPLFIEDVLESQGIDLSNWWLLSARVVTPDGRTIAGEGVVNPPATCEEIDDDVDKQLWVATLPLP